MAQVQAHEIEIWCDNQVEGFQAINILADIAREQGFDVAVDLLQGQIPRLIAIRDGVQITILRSGRSGHGTTNQMMSRSVFFRANQISSHTIAAQTASSLLWKTRQRRAQEINLSNALSAFAPLFEMESLQPTVFQHMQQSRPIPRHAGQICGCRWPH